MNQKVGITVSATADTSQVEQAINALGQKIAQANRVQYSPVSTKSLDDVKKLNAALAEMLKTQAGLRQRVKATGQDATPFADWDWQRMYPHAASRGVAMQGAFERVVGPGRFTAPPPAQPQQPNQPQPGGGGAGMGTRIVQAGLSAAGPVGGVASGALGTGMSAGFGAGLMGLVGGIAALGVGKLVSAIAEKVGQAEQLEVDYDTLKRKLGDVGVGFDALKGVVQGSAKQLSITFDEAGKLSAQFAKLSNLSGDQFKTIGDEMETGVGLSRSFGLDPSQGVGMLGQMRGMGITTNTQESRRFALLLGETIGKSGAFAKAEEVFEAIGGYATSQTRNSMGAANVAGYAGMYSSMVGSGIPGMDPSGAAGLLNKINSVLSTGGAKGEASQFFTGIVGNRMGLNPFQTQVLREGGAFATNSEAFGADSAYGRYMGEAGPKGDTTFLQGSLDELRRQYGGNKDMLAMATANHLGVGARQAMALLELQPNQMGEMQDYAGDLTKMSGKGIGNLSKALYGSAGDRSSLKADFLGRTGADAISAEDRKALESADTDKKLQATLATIAAKYDQERTTGSDIRDSKNALENLKVDMASKLIPMTQAMRDGILYMAGGRNKSRLDVMKEIEGLESSDREKKIKGDISYRNELLNNTGSELQSRLAGLNVDRLRVEHKNDPAKLAEKLKEREQVLAAIAENDKKRVDLGKEQRDLLQKENDLRKQNIKAIEEAHAAELSAKMLPPPPDANQSAAESARLARHGRSPVGAGESGRRGGYDPLSNTGSLDQKLAEAESRAGLPAGVLRAVVQQETGGKKDYIDDPAKYHYPLDENGRRVAPHTGKVSTAFGPFGILESTANRPGYGVDPLKDKSIDEQIRFASDYLAARSRSAGGIEGGLAGYGEGSRYSSSVMRRMRNQPPMAQGTPAGDLGAGGGSGSRPSAAYNVTADDITVRIVDDKTGKPIGPPLTIPTRVGAASPLGSLHSGGVTGQW
jgi:hypothetical protein